MPPVCDRWFLTRHNFPAYLDDDHLPLARVFLAHYMPWIHGGPTLQVPASQIRVVFSKVYETALRRVAEWEKLHPPQPASPSLEQRVAQLRMF